MRAKQRREGLTIPRRSTLPTGNKRYASEEEERADREERLLEHSRILGSYLPLLLTRFKKIVDPRNPRTIKHKITVVLLTGMLLFVYNMSSRREANRDMSRPVFLANLKRLFPELESLPHQDTVNRLLSLIEVDEIEATHLERSAAAALPPLRTTEEIRPLPLGPHLSPGIRRKSKAV